MNDPAPVVVVPGPDGPRRVPVDTPLLRADDLGVVRGDGVFETVHVRGGQPWLMPAHCDRMAQSAARLELALPERAVWEQLATAACAAWPPEREGALRLVCTRGPEGGDAVTAYATLQEVGARLRTARRDGVAVLTATAGFVGDARGAAPWLLGGVKALSYAVNMASQRWAASQGADDALWVSADGYALEAPTSTLLWLASGELCTVPSGETGVLPGTTARWLLDHAGSLGLTARERMVAPAALHTADGVWLASSVRGLAPVRTLDGSPLPASAATTALQELVGHPVPD